jgi:hypothetical protein
MATLKDCVVTIPMSGFCEIDIEKAISLFDKHCFISKWKGESDEYRLVRCRLGRGNFRGLKVTISESDALTLIDRMGLVEVKSVTFNSGSSFHDPVKSVTFNSGSSF